MIIFKRRHDLAQYLHKLTKAGKAVGFVPTMGALHKGHISLVTKAHSLCDVVVASIFVNPAQFNNKEDFDKYPITTAQDIALLEEASCHVLFLPEFKEMYPDGVERAKDYHFGYLETILEGAHRPGHFSGVGKVVAILLEAVQPNVLFLGQKDFQQCMVINNLVQQMGLQSKIRLEYVPTMREDDGLAMSSRNRRLTPPQRALAGVIYQCLVSIVTKKNIADFAVIKKECWDLLTEKGFKPEYVALADAETLQLLDNYDHSKKMVALIAAHLGSVRLIDNMLIK